MEFIIITGLSGAGKSVAMKSMEDIGYYCVDNIPPMLLTTFYDLCEKSSDERMKKIAVVTDVRAGDAFDDLFEALDSFKADKKNYKILFLDARDDILLRRFKETRRKHPLMEVCKGSTENAVVLERSLLMQVKARADYVIDTSLLSGSQLRERISALFLGNASLGMTVTCLSFGFKYGIPAEADLVFDVRCLPNPFYIPELKYHTGLEACVYDYVMSFEQSKGFAERMISLVDYTLPLYLSEGKSQLVIAVGCTGGQHRSVTLTRVLYEHILESRQRAIVHHRDVSKNKR
ncbi:MAG: RNase adapter RapZ [Clostridia bacterium]|nr:RNase adapter RapZ [Clostridia bacterium]